MNTSHRLWPNGRVLAITSCWDDGTEHDRRLIEIFNRHGLKASFNLCSGKLGLDARQSGWKNFVRAEEVATLYRGHEVCAHSVNHPRPWSVPEDQFRWELLEDRRHLETLAGYPVRGLALPYGWWAGREWSREFARSCGFHYLRHTVSLPQFEPPADFLDWRPTCHCGEDLEKAWASLLARRDHAPGQLFYLWGHSYEFEDTLGWEGIERFAARVVATPGVWHATKGEVYDYLTAWHRLEWLLDGTGVRNPSAIPVWFGHQGQVLQVAPGQLLQLPAGD